MARWIVVLFVLIVIVLAIVVIVHGNAAPVSDESPPFPPAYEDCYALSVEQCDLLHIFVNTWNTEFGGGGVRVDTWRYVLHLVDDVIVEAHPDFNFDWTAEEVWIPVKDAGGVVVDATPLPTISL